MNEHSPRHDPHTHNTKTQNQKSYYTLTYYIKGQNCHNQEKGRRATGLILLW